jgi:flagellar biosynthesis protein FlhF
MELKRILARDSRSANEKAIQLYGSDVLIISSQRLDNQIELIVATDVDPAVPPTAKGDLPSAQAPSQTPVQKPFLPFSQLLDEVNTRQDLGVSDDGVISGHEKWPNPSHTPSSLPLTSGERLNIAHESQRSLEIVDMLRQEMASLRKEFTLSRQMQPWQDGLRLSPTIQPLFQAMNEAGVPAALRALLTDSIQSLDSLGEALAVMQNLLLTSLERTACRLQPRLAHALCGPSGAGKTSMVGRLAHAAAQKEGPEKQAMVSFADHRPGAWAQMQLLASQSGVDCFRVADAAMLGTLLEDLQGRTVWIDTCGADFSAQAEVLQLQCPQVLRHAVLPVDATVTSVQKILQNSTASWSTLMLSKVDEAAHPWALVKGLTENNLPVSWVAGDSRIAVPAQAFDASVLVQLALMPMANLLGTAVEVQGHSEVLKDVPKKSTKPKKAATSTLLKTNPSTPPGLKKQRINPLDAEEIEIPTLMGKSLSRPPRSRSNPSISA